MTNDAPLDDPIMWPIVATVVVRRSPLTGEPVFSVEGADIPPAMLSDGLLSIVQKCLRAGPAAFYGFEDLLAKSDDEDQRRQE